MAVSEELSEGKMRYYLAKGLTVHTYHHYCPLNFGRLQMFRRKNSLDFRF